MVGNSAAAQNRSRTSFPLAGKVAFSGAYPMRRYSGPVATVPVPLFLLIGFDRYHNAPSSFMILHVFVCVCDFRQRKLVDVLEPWPLHLQSGVHIAGRGGLSLGGEVVAAQEKDPDVIKHQRPERDQRRRLLRRIGGQGASLS
jgi:hypothetical protein